MVDFHWADKTAQNIIDQEDKKSYVLASGITPSGVVHIGNFREVITTHLIAKALEKKGKKVRHVYSWDDYDVFRKVPANMPDPEVLKKFLRKPIVDVPDTFNEFSSYAERNEKLFEIDLPRVGIKTEFIYQSKMYRECKYADDISKALKNTEKIKEILDKFRKEPLESSWFPVSVFCDSCSKDTTKVTAFDGEYALTYTCSCGFSETFDFRKKGIVKLLWRVDWPMRWAYESVDFEAGGKDHSSPGGSFDTGKEIVKALWGRDAPLYIMYDFIILKGIGGKISSSSGNVITLNEVLEVYTPDIVRWLFAGSRPGSEFAISFDLDVLKVYEDFSRCETIYFESDSSLSEKELENQKRIYELSKLKIPKKLPEQVTFRHLVNYVQLYDGDIEKATKEFSSDEVKEKAKCAWAWVNKYAPEDLKFTVRDEVSKDIKDGLSADQKNSIKLLVKSLESKGFTEESLFEEFYTICQSVGLDNKEFFKGVYRAIIAKEKGPKLAYLILALGKERVISILKQV